MFKRKSTFFFIFMGINIALFCLMLVHASLRKKNDLPHFREKIEIVKKLGLTDLCLFTDARYTRHLSMADLNTPFQDYPMSFEHFPSGSLLKAPLHLSAGGLQNAAGGGKYR